jgi:tryptophan-rich sensory protein
LSIELRSWKCWCYPLSVTVSDLSATSHPTVIGVIICLGTAVLEGLLSGSGVRKRLAELRMPRFAPPFWVWTLVGLGQYTIFFLVLRSLLAGPPSAYSTTALAVAILLLLLNATWNAFFFRLRDLRTSLLLFVPYDILAVVLAVLLWVDANPWAGWFSLYPAYLSLATAWGYRVWRLNATSS